MKKYFQIKLFSIIIASLAVVGGIIGMCVAYFVNPLVEIYVKDFPTKTEYFETEQFDASGLKIVARYKYYNVEKEIEDFEILVDSPLNTESTSVTISYSEKGVTKTISFNITVKQRKITEMVILSQPLKTEYFEGEFFDVKGLELQVNCEDGAKSFEPKNIQIAKENISLTTNDKSIAISYTENGKTVLAFINIIVKEITTEQEETQVAENLIGFLPEYDEVDIDDESTIEYIKDVYDKLSQAQKEEVGADKVLQDLTTKIEQLKKEQEVLLNRQYSINYISKQETTDFNPNNSSTYKNAQGSVDLLNPISEELYNKGYDFSHWEDKKGNKVTQLYNITEDTTYYAIFELSNLINLKFINITDDTEIGVMSVQRFNGTNFQYNLINNEVNNFIFEVLNQMPTNFYLSKISNPVTTLATSQGRSVDVFVETLPLNDLVDKNLPEQQENSAIFVFGENVKEFALSDGYLQQRAISDIYAYYNEQNENYLNYYLVDEEKKVYADLEKINFNDLESKTVVVTKVDNNFTITIDYKKKKISYSGLKGKQTILDALIEYSDNDENILTFIDGLDEYFDLSQMLYDDVLLKMHDRISFDIILHNGTETSTINIPNESTENYQLTENLPKLQKLGYIFVGWALSEGENALSDEYINIIMQNKNKNSELFAVWKINPNYDFPSSSVNYTHQFVGKWSAVFNHDGKIIEANLNLKANGIYEYTIKSNGLINSTIMGEYRFEENKLVVYSLSLDGDYQLIQKSDLSFDLTYLDSNILVTNCFYITKNDSSIQVERFDVVLNSGNIKFANYYGKEFLGKYQFYEKDVLTNVINSYIIELFNNGYANVTVNNKIINVVYRVVENKIIILSNDVLGVKDLTEYINDSNRV